jgi:hypothetical protein
MSLLTLSNTIFVTIISRSEEQLDFILSSCIISFEDINIASSCLSSSTLHYRSSCANELFNGVESHSTALSCEHDSSVNVLLYYFSIVLPG